MKSIYLVGSLKNPRVPEIGIHLRKLGFDVFDDWHSAGKTADRSWQEYEMRRGRTYDQALQSYASKHIVAFDRQHLIRCDIGVLVMPAGKSGHLEIGFMAGQGKAGFVLCHGAPREWDQMYNLCRGLFFDLDSLCRALQDKRLTARRKLSVSNNTRAKNRNHA